MFGYLGRKYPGWSHRKFIVVGPCSIHDIKAAEEYSERLKIWINCCWLWGYTLKTKNNRGMERIINDPDMDDSFPHRKGLFIARSLLLKLAELVTTATALDPIIPQYIGELIAWSAIEPARLNHKLTAKWQVDFPCLWVLKRHWWQHKWLWMPCNQLKYLTIF